MSFLRTIANFIGALLGKVAPYLFAYKAGELKKQHDFDESIKRVLREDNERLMHIATTSPAVLADELRERARKKRENQD